MNQLIKIKLYGSHGSCAHAMTLLENQPQIQKITRDEKTGELSLMLNARLKECDLVALLADSGISSLKVIV